MEDLSSGLGDRCRYAISHQWFLMNFNKLTFALLSAMALIYTAKFDEPFWFDEHEIEVSATQLEALSKTELERDKQLDSLRKPLAIAERKLKTTSHKFREILFEYDNLLEQSLTLNQIKSLNFKRSQAAQKSGREKSDFMRRFASFLDAVSIYSEVSVFEGLPRATDKELAKLRKDHETIVFDGWPFYATPLRPNQSQIENLRSALTAYRDFRHHPKNTNGGKGCGGFHPDFYLRWGSKNQEYHVLICLGCNELKFVSPTAQTIFDFDNKAWQSFAHFAIATFQFHKEGIEKANESRMNQR